MVEVSPGEQKYADGDSVPHTLGSDTAVAGDAMVISASSGDLILTDGSNGFGGVLGTETAAGSQDSSVASGDDAVLQLQGVVRVNVASGVSAGNKLVPSSTTSGQLETIDSNGDGTADPAEPGDIMALTDADADGYALARLP
jgi:hypothetical protein